MWTRSGSSVRSVSSTWPDRGGQSLQLGRDHSVVARGRGKNFARQIDARRQRSLLRGFQFGRHTRVVRGIGDHRYALEIFRGRAQHRRPADVDVFDQLFRGQTALRRCRFKWIQIHDDEIDRRDSVFRRLRLIVFVFTAIEQTAVYLRVQRLHAAAQHFRPAGEVRYIAHGDVRFAQQLRRSARRENFDLQRRKPLREFHDARLVKHADQRALHCHAVSSSWKAQQCNAPHTNRNARDEFV